MNVTLVSGPPCAGKSTYVMERRDVRDVVLDFDDVCEQQGGQRYDRSPGILAAAAARFQELVGDLALNVGEPGEAWIVTTSPRRWQRKRYRDTIGVWRSIVLLVEQDELIRRAELERPLEWAAFVPKWFAEYQPDPFDEVLVWDEGWTSYVEVGDG